ncbi:MAG: DUF3078 domain-containing protein [Muribaculaceae bacterium]
MNRGRRIIIRIITIIVALITFHEIIAQTKIVQKSDSLPADTAIVAVVRGVDPITLNDWRSLDFDTIELRESYAFVPLIFRHQKLSTDTIAQWHSPSGYALNVDRDWINNEITELNKVDRLRYSTIASTPQAVIYNSRELPEAPKEFISVVDPKKRTLSIVAPDYKDKVGLDAQSKKIKMHNWLHTFTTTLQFTQAYMSENWYQGGNNNLNILGDFQWTVELNQILHPNYLFSNTVRYKIGINSAPNDTLRSYSISDDLLQINTQIGIKAVKKWYYSATMQFKTQVLNNYAANTNNRNTSLLSPGELNVGVGITYNNASKDNWRTFNLSIQPVSYNMKMCISDENPSATRFGIKEGHHTAHDVGSKLEARVSCKFNQSVSWSSRLYVFSNYEYVQGDWENTFNFNVTRNLITQFYTHLRYDKSAARNDKWNFWQFKEILSFGITYRFATN